jgi:hypothetical protein
MKKTAPEKWADRSPIPPTQDIKNPDFPNRRGVAATTTAILIFVALFCIFQYWLLTATLEAYHAGDKTLPLGAFFASLACFIFSAGLAILGEIALMKQQQYLRKNTSVPVKNRSEEPPINRQGPTGAIPPSEMMTTKAGGGDAG